MRRRHLLNTKAVLWNTPVPDGYGNFEYDDPKTLKVRWEDTQEWFRGEDGVEKLSDAVAYSLQKIEPGARMAKGTLANAELSNSSKVEKRKECQDIKGRTVMWKLWLL